MNRILLVEDHASFREPLAFMFEREAEFTVAAQAGSLAEAREVLEGVDLALLDLDLPDGSGLGLIEGLRAANPDVTVMVLSGSTDRMHYARAVEAGATAVLHKSTRISGIIDAVRRVSAGETLLSANEVVELLNYASRQRSRDRDTETSIQALTPREREILQALAEGLSNKEVADRLYISPRTQRTHMANILAKLGLNSQMQALLFAVRHGIVELPR